jgi:hypothetical protein
LDRRSFLGALAAGAAGASTAPAAVHHDVIRLDREFQEVENFGASDCWSMQKIGGWSEEGRNRVADLLFSTTRGIGLSCWRFNIGGGINPRITNLWRTAETFETGEGQYDWTRQNLNSRMNLSFSSRSAGSCAPPKRATFPSSWPSPTARPAG